LLNFLGYFSGANYVDLCNIFVTTKFAAVLFLGHILQKFDVSTLDCAYSQAMFSVVQEFFGYCKIAKAIILGGD
jgi:hypothetical protein